MREKKKYKNEYSNFVCLMLEMRQLQTSTLKKFICANFAGYSLEKKRFNFQDVLFTLTK